MKDLIGESGRLPERAGVKERAVCICGPVSRKEEEYASVKRRKKIIADGREWEEGGSSGSSSHFRNECTVPEAKN